MDFEKKVVTRTVYIVEFTEEEAQHFIQQVNFFSRCQPNVPQTHPFVKVGDALHAMGVRP